MAYATRLLRNPATVNRLLFGGLAGFLWSHHETPNINNHWNYRRSAGLLDWLLPEQKISELEAQLEQEVIFSKETQQELAVAQNELASAEADHETALFKLANVQQQLAAKDKKISELKAQLSAALEHPPQ